MHEIRAFGTPTVVLFCASLLISAIMTAPLDAVFPLAVCLALLGAAGLAYAVTVIRHARKQKGYNPDAGDWFWYIALPLVAYLGLAAEGILLAWNVACCLYLIAVNTLLLLFIGIHNSWDTVTYVAVDRPKSKQDKQP